MELEMCKYGITGGGGFLGYRLALLLLQQQPSAFIRLLDIRRPDPKLHTTCFADGGGDIQAINEGRIEFIKCDLRDYSQVETALRGCNAVFHVASYGMSGKEMCNRKLIEETNIGGTKNIIAACEELNMSRLIYVSTYNVVFYGQSIINGSESTCSYVPSERHLDHYSYTKCEAEQLVLSANSNELRTCAIRSAAIYGDGEERHTPRILKLVGAGMCKFAIGNPNILCDWVFVDNLAHGLILANAKLAREKSSPSKGPGQAYFISDDHPVNNFTFLGELIRAMDYDGIFLFYIPTVILFYIGYLLEIVQRLCAPIFLFTPIMNRAEVVKVGVTHYMSLEKAKKELNYSPIVSTEEAMKRCIEWYSINGYKKNPSSGSSVTLIFPAILIVFVLYVLLIVNKSV